MKRNLFTTHTHGDTCTFDSIESNLINKINKLFQSISAWSLELIDAAKFHGFLGSPVECVFSDIEFRKSWPNIPNS